MKTCNALHFFIAKLVTEKKYFIGKVNMELQLDATITVLLISKISSTCYGQTFAHLQERKTFLQHMVQCPVKMDKLHYFMLSRVSGCVLLCLGIIVVVF
jgi:hypothetical protein